MSNIEFDPCEDSFNLNVQISLDGEDMKSVNKIWDRMEEDVVRLVFKGVIEELETEKQEEGV